MITFAPYRQRPEARNYTDTQVSAAVAEANAETASAAVATIEAASRLWEFGLMGARSDVLQPWQLAIIGRQLLLRGESVWWRSRASGFYACESVTVTGASPSPVRWSYLVTMPAPSGVLTRTASSDTVLHARIGASPREPWRGCSPILSSAASRSALEQIERSLAHEHQSPVGHVIGVSDPSSQQQTTNEIAALKGRTILTDASETGVVSEGGTGSRNRWEPQRIGPDPSRGTIEARKAIESSILAAAGVPLELVYPGAGSDAREAFRRFVHLALTPVANLLSAELQRMGLEPEIDLSGLAAADIASKARAFGVLVTNGVEMGEAKAVVGLE